MALLIAVYGLAGLDMALCALSQTALWQRKEYRLDRMKAYLFSPEKSVFQIAVWVVSLLCALTAFFMPLLAYISLFVLLGGYAVRAMKRGVVRPKFTMRAIAVCVLAIILSGVALLFISNILWISLIVAITPLIVAVCVWVIAIPSALKKSDSIQKAITYRTSLTQLQVIGITGSVGKTSTKTYALHLLENDDQEILATKKHRNSPYVVALDVLSQITKHTNAYIAELGAYKKGEIAELCEIVQPTIGVITAITNQHAALFGSVENLAQAKWELAEAIPENGMLVLNKDDKNIRTLAESYSNSITWYSMKESADVMFESVVLRQGSVSCVLGIDQQRFDVTIPVISRGQLGSVLAACTIARVMGMSGEDIMKKLATLPVLEKTMEYKKLRSGAVVIDDSYSASEASVMNAIEYLNAVGGEDALLVLVPIIELGDEAAAVHARIGAALAQAQFQTYIYGTAYQEDIMKGLSGVSHLHVTWYTDPKTLAEDVATQVIEQNMIVFEGRLPGIVTNV